MKAEIRVPDPDEPYRDIITNFVVDGFPDRFSREGIALDAVSEALVGTGAVRYGPRPTPEKFVSIRNVVRFWMEQNKPIPILVAWGSKKPMNGLGVDVAELSGLKMLECLHKRVSRYYEPGIIANVRIEDATGWYMFSREGEHAIHSSQMYVDSLLKLMGVIDLEFVTPRLESLMVAWDDLKNTTDSFRPLVQKYLTTGDETWLQAMKERGWKGHIPPKQVEYYHRRYAGHKPDITESEAFEMMSDYFALSWARYVLNMRGDDAEWEGKYLTVSFVPPVPGSPTSLSERTLFYRVLPDHISRNHLMPWRAKGYLEIGDKAIPKLISFRTMPELHECEVHLVRGSREVTMRMDYLAK